MDLDPAEPATTRRRMIGAVGAVGLAAAVGALAMAHQANAAPYTPTEADRSRLDVLMRLELTARDLYRASVGAGLDGVAGDLASTFADNHQACAEAIAGISGLSATAGIASVYKQFESPFATSDIETWTKAAYEFESTFVATHTEATSGFEAIEPINLVASILVVEARQAMVLADVGGFLDDVDVLNATDATALELTTLVQSGEDGA